MRYKHIFCITLVILIIFLSNKGLNNFSSCFSSNNITSFDSYKKFINPKDENILKLIFTGDIMLGSNYPDSTILPPDSGKYLFENVTDFLKEGDIVCGNLEGVFYEGDEMPKGCKNMDSCYIFRIPPVLAPNLFNAGFTFLSLANNHMYDFGHHGKNFTKKILDSLGILYAGLIEAPFAIKEINGVTVGFIAFAPNSGTLQFRNIDIATQMVSALTEMTDVVIVSFHGGGEGIDFRNVNRETEFYRGENRGNPYAFAHRVIDAGADVVFGHGPHVTRGIELYNNKLIMYSLGNFCTYGQFNIKSHGGIAPLVMVNVNNKGDFLNGHIIPLKLIGKGMPALDIERSAIFEMQRLSLIDFPESPLFIDDNGSINIDRISLNILTNNRIN
ncbi:MAG: CapA family protein [Bacteroidales bacterium]|nr:CapA family protein [Bacteroidales bacterium]